MKTGTAIWLIGWLFVFGAIEHDGIKNNPNHKLNLSKLVITAIIWPVCLGYEYQERICR